MDDNFIAKNLPNLDSVAPGDRASSKLQDSPVPMQGFSCAVGKGEALQRTRHSLADPVEGPEHHTLPIWVPSQSQRHWGNLTGASWVLSKAELEGPRSEQKGRL